MKVIINENQLRLLNEDLASQSEVSYDLKESIAIWCLVNDFRFFLPNNIFGRRISVANSEPINKEICNDIMDGTLTLANEEKELFGYNDYDDFEDGDDEREEYMDGNEIYKVQTSKETYYIEVSADIYEYYGDLLLQDYEDKELDPYSRTYELVGWFHKIYR